MRGPVAFTQLTKSLSTISSCQGVFCDKDTKLVFEGFSIELVSTWNEIEKGGDFC